MAKLPKQTTSNTNVADNDQVTGSVIFRRVDPEKKNELKKLIKDIAKEHGLFAHVIERK